MNLLEMIGVAFIVLFIFNLVVCFRAMRFATENNEENTPYIKVHRENIY